MESILEVLGRPSIGLVICPKRMESILEILGRPSIGFSSNRQKMVLIIGDRTKLSNESCDRRKRMESLSQTSFSQPIEFGIWP